MAKLIGESKFHRTLNGIELCKLRERLKLSQSSFADLCGWSRQYQSQLESPGTHEITVETANKILAVSKNASIYLLDTPKTTS